MGWKKKKLSNNRIILTSKLEKDDPRDSILEENYEIKEYGIKKNNYNNIDELQFWIDRDIFDETEKIQEFNEKCKKWGLGYYIDNKITLSVNNEIDFNLFNLIEDEEFEKFYKKYLLTYNGKAVNIKTNIIDNFEVESKEWDGIIQKYIRIPYD